MRIGTVLGFVALMLSMPGAAQVHRELLLKPDSPEFTKAAPAVSTVRLETSKGNIDIEVTRAWSPLGADRFINLIRLGFFDEARFFRITPGRWAQFGIPADPAIAQAWRDRALADDPFKQSNVRGTVAFAFSGKPNTRTTQVFINLRDNSETHDKEPFVIFGEVVQGMDVADALYAEYGEAAGGGIRAGKQAPVFEGGNAYLKANFPLLDYIRKATVLR